MTGITVVVGVIANLGLYSAVHTLFSTSHTIAAGPLHLELPDVIAAVLIFRAVPPR